MSANIKYHSVVAENDKESGFQEFDTVDFVLTGEGRKLVKNSILLSYDLQVNSSFGTPKVTTDQIRYNHKIGGHSFYESFQVSIFLLKGVGLFQKMLRLVVSVWHLIVFRQPERLLFLSQILNSVLDLLLL